MRIIVLTFILISFLSTNGEYFSAVEKLKKLVSDEKLILDEYKKYSNFSKNNFIHRYES